MKEIFKNWDKAWEAINDENTAWYQLMVNGEEVLAYEDTDENILLSDEPVEDPAWIEVEL